MFCPKQKVRIQCPSLVGVQTPEIEITTCCRHPDEVFFDIKQVRRGSEVHDELAQVVSSGRTTPPPKLPHQAFILPEKRGSSYIITHPGPFPHSVTLLGIH